MSAPATVVHVVVPAGIDEPLRPTGGNVYDREVCDKLAVLGWEVHEHAVGGDWPFPDEPVTADLGAALNAIPDDALVLIDGLVASAAPDVLISHANRVREVVLLHLPLGIAHPEARPDERAVLTAAAAVVTPSRWTRQWLGATYGLRSRVHVAEPGVEPARPARGTAAGDRLLCVGAVAPHKGHELLIDALAGLGDLSWSIRLAGSLDVAPGFAARVRRQAGESGLAGRISFLGPLRRSDLDQEYAGADALVLASRIETYGIVAAEALARGLPVIATAAGGVPEALGHARDGRRPGLLVPPGDAGALGAAIRSFLTDRSLREKLRDAAADRGRAVPRWLDTAATVARILRETAAGTIRPRVNGK